MREIQKKSKRRLAHVVQVEDVALTDDSSLLWAGATISLIFNYMLIVWFYPVNCRRQFIDDELNVNIPTQNQFSKRLTRRVVIDPSVRLCMCVCACVCEHLFLLITNPTCRALTWAVRNRSLVHVDLNWQTDLPTSWPGIEAELVFESTLDTRVCFLSSPGVGTRMR